MVPQTASFPVEYPLIILHSTVSSDPSIHPSIYPSIHTSIHPSQLASHPFIRSSIYGFTVFLLDLGRFFSFLILFTVGSTPWTGDQPLARPRPTRRTTKTQNKRTQTSMPSVGFEPMIPAFERAKTVHALDRAATVIGYDLLIESINRQTPENIPSYKSIISLS
jgi:hypothetical protein